MIETDEQPKEQPKGTNISMTYEDEKGNKLYGFSQAQIDKLTKTVRVLITVLVIIGVTALTIIFGLLWWLNETNYLTRILEAIL